MKARHKKAVGVLLYPDRSAHALLRCIRSFARLDGHEAEELGEERDEVEEVEQRGAGTQRLDERNRYS